MSVKWVTDSTPPICHIESERSATISKFIVRKVDGTLKEYTLKTTREGKLILN